MEVAASLALSSCAPPVSFSSSCSLCLWLKSSLAAGGGPGKKRQKFLRGHWMILHVLSLIRQPLSRWKEVIVVHRHHQLQSLFRADQIRIWRSLTLLTQTRSNRGDTCLLSLSTRRSN
ncbi:hypothetical protein NXS19_001470 [Fusarium pseudograminearum]|nr:hypothetical protein NXS19_001470 [Fusarium pseudograminearum]